MWLHREDILSTVADAVASLFGMGCQIFLYGPVGEKGGEMDVVRCVFHYMSFGSV